MKIYGLNFLQERDKDGTGVISYEQLEEIYRIYQVSPQIREVSSTSSPQFQVELDDSRVTKMVDDAGMISKEDFAQFAKDTHLLDFETNMGDASPMALLSPRKTRKQPQTPKLIIKFI